MPEAKNKSNKKDKMSLKSVFRIIGRSFELFVHNLKVMIPFILQFIIPMLILIPALSILFPNYLDYYSQPEALSNYFTSSITSQNSVYLILLLLAVIFIWIFMLSGILGFIKDIISGKAARLKDVFSYGKKFSLKILAIVLISIILLVLFYFPINFLAGWIAGIFKLASQEALDVILQIMLSLVVIFFIPAPYILVAFSTGILESLRRSLILSWRNYFYFLVLLVSLNLISLAVDFIQVVGQVVNVIVVFPVINIAVMLFVLEAGKNMAEKNKKAI